MGLMLNGISVSKGIAIGKANFLHRDQLDISEYTIPKPLLGEEIARFKAAIKNAKRQLKSIRNKIPSDTPPEITAFIDTHLLMLEDVALTVAPINIIKKRQCNAEWAVKQQRDALVSVFEAMDDPYLRTRKDDVDHVVNSIQTCLQAQVDQPQQSTGARLKGSIVLADDLSPADMMLMQHRGVEAFVTEFGGPNSHTAILARSIGVPAIVGIHHVRNYVKQNELLVVDGQQGFIIAAPQQHEVAYFRKQQRIAKNHLAQLAKIKDKPAVSSDGHKITLLANVELPDDIRVIKRVAAEGVGLFRTEMLFMNRDEFPDESEQFQAYQKVVRALKGMPVTIRTLDLGADKRLNGNQQQGAMATNPALGLRAIRWCLQDPALFRPQIRAILRSSAYGPVRIMIPMLSTTDELLQVLRMVEDEKKTLRNRGVKFDENIPIGGMIEVPAAAIAADTFAKHLDFFSIGTNDLIQYTLAVDRLDDTVNYLYDPLHPAILRLIHMVIVAGRKAGIPVAMCGEMAGDIRYTRLLLGMGLTEFSMFPASLLEVKHIINTSTVDTLSRQAKRVLKMSHADEIADFMERINTTG